LVHLYLFFTDEEDKVEEEEFSDEDPESSDDSDNASTYTRGTGRTLQATAGASGSTCKWPRMARTTSSLVEEVTSKRKGNATCLLCVIMAGLLIPSVDY